jgi:hypothetical protein
MKKVPLAAPFFMAARFRYRAASGKALAGLAQKPAI